MLYYINGLAGSGKTHTAIIEDAVWRVQFGERIMVAMPTMELINKTIAEIPEGRIRISKIVSDEVENVQAALIEKLRTPYFQGELVFITHAGWKLIPHWQQVTDWKLILDEAPNVTDMLEIKASDHDLQTLLEHCVDVSCPYAGVRIIELRKHPKSVIDFPAQVSEQKPIHKLAYRLADKNSMVIISAKNCDEIFYAFCVTLPGLLKPFESALIMAANFTDSMIYRLWKVGFREHKALTSNLRFQEHDGSNVTINYLFEDGWSRSFFEGPYFGKRILDSVVEKIKKLWISEPVVWVANKGELEANTFGEASTRLPNISHGLNDYRHFHNVIFLSALNPSNTELGFFKALGVSRDEVQKARYLEAVYQAVMRSALRNNDGATVRVLVMDRPAAEHLNNLLRRSTVERLDWFSDIKPKNKGGRPATGNAMTPSERKRLSRARKKGNLTPQAAWSAQAPPLASVDDVTKTNIEDSKIVIVTDVEPKAKPSHAFEGFHSTLASVTVHDRETWCENACAFWRSHANGRHPRYKEEHLFLLLAFNLMEADLSTVEISNMLLMEAAHSRRAKSLRKEIPHIMAKVKKKAALRPVAN